MTKSEQNPVLPQSKPHGYEFAGPWGAFAISAGVPLIVYSAAFLCNDITGCPVPSLLHPQGLTLSTLKSEIGWPANGVLGLASFQATACMLGYYLLSLVLLAALPGIECQGGQLASGGRLKYKFNAFSSAMFIMSIALIGTLVRGPDFVLWTFINDNFVQLITANLGIAFALACFVYVRSFSVKAGNSQMRELAAGGHSGNLLYDFFIGRELNPRIDLPWLGTWDIKTFMEERPGLLGWVLLDLAFAAKQYERYGYVTDSMALTVIFQALYVFDSLWMEPAILTQIDITTDGFGFMLAVGDLVWVPFIYSLQARYLSTYPVHLGAGGILGVLTIQAIGFYIFRASNNEKNWFRRNPDDPRVAHLKCLETSSGGKLLISGWWGMARHINYLGDWIMGWSYCLPTGIAGYVVQRSATFSSGNRVVQGDARGWGMVFTYFYLVYFAILLVHRGRRDEEKCKRKYGEDWEVYKQHVCWKIVPGIY